MLPLLLSYFNQLNCPLAYLKKRLQTFQAIAGRLVTFGCLDFPSTARLARVEAQNNTVEHNNCVTIFSFFLLMKKQTAEGSKAF
jgi:hypothetical protein